MRDSAWTCINNFLRLDAYHSWGFDVWTEQLSIAQSCRNTLALVLSMVEKIFTRLFLEFSRDFIDVIHASEFLNTSHFLWFSPATVRSYHHQSYPGCTTDRCYESTNRSTQSIPTWTLTILSNRVHSTWTEVHLAEIVTHDLWGD